MLRPARDLTRSCDKMRLATVLVLSLLAWCTSAKDDQFAYVTCGSAVKLKHKGSGFTLHSHPIKWGSGSGQQSVTGLDSASDNGGLWQVKAPVHEQPCLQGTPIACGSAIRLMHVKTQNYLHSHLHRSPLGGRQEVSAFGNNQGTQSDTGDNWRVECSGDKWAKDKPVRFVHVDTGKQLYASKSAAFDNNNCRGCPIIGQLEVSTHSTSPQDGNAQWTTADGIYLADNTFETETDD